ncbi:MAG TPA: universal stress protein [Puia sp.]|nr:universal stress protein [Puia sp.]
MKSLLVPINYTDNAANAARYAADLALALEADLHLLHVLDLGYAFEQTEENGRHLLDSVRAQLLERTHGQIAVTTRLTLGDVEAAIEESCRRLDPFAVLMGADDVLFHGGFAENHITRALARLRKPLLVIPSGATFHAIRKIVLACELKDIASELPVSLGFLQQLKTVFSCSFDILNISGREDKGLSDVFRATLQDLYPELHFLRSSHVEEGIHDYLKANPVDWLMVFPKKHGLLEFHNSHAKRIVTNCPIPILSIRA